MPYHLALIGELRHHVPPNIPYVTGVPLAYHWFFYADAAATSWATGIEPVVLLYRLSMLPMFVAFVVLTPAAARRLTGGWWTGPVAVAIALFGTIASPYRWTATPVFDAQTLDFTWISPTHSFGLAVFAAVLVVVLDLVHAETSLPLRYWLLVALLISLAAGAKASLLPLLIAGLVVVIAGAAIGRRRLHQSAVAALTLAAIGLGLATMLLYLGTTGGLIIGLASGAFPVARAAGGVTARGYAEVVLVSLVGWLLAVVLWSFLWAGAYGLLARGPHRILDSRILLLAGIATGALGAVSIFAYQGDSQAYFLRGAAGVLGVLTTAGIAAVLPSRASYRPLIALVGVVAVLGGLAVLAVAQVGPAKIQTVTAAHLSGVMSAIVLPVLGLLALTAMESLGLARFERTQPVVRGAVPLLVIALVMGFSLPNVARVLVSPLQPQTNSPSVPGDGIIAARWLRDHSDLNDLVASDLHCRALVGAANACDARHFWVSAYAERHVLVEGWAYTAPAIAIGLERRINDRTVPFWDPALLAANDGAFTDPSPATVGALRDEHGVRWLFADATRADVDGLERQATLRFRQGDFAVFELLRP
jgi:hypothetical protein